jgi:hypothetical protein
MTMRTRHYGLIAVVAAIALAGGTVAYASIPDTNGVIHGCYKKASPNQGTVRVIDTEKAQACSSNEKALDWNQTGPQGPQGLQGPQGQTGPPGPPTPPPAWFVTTGAFQIGQDPPPFPADSQFHTLLSKTLPGGVYSVVASLGAQLFGSGGVAWCSLFVNATELDFQGDGDHDHDDLIANLTLMSDASLPGGGTVSIQCLLGADDADNLIGSGIVGHMFITKVDLQSQ